MKWLACLVAVALAVPCSATGPRAEHASKKPARLRPAVDRSSELQLVPDRLLSDRLVRAILRPDLEAARRAADYFIWRQFIRRMLPPGATPVDLDRPIRAAHFGR